MSKINPGSNVYNDNEIETAVPGMLNVDIPEPKMMEKGKYQYPVCDRIFPSRESYLSHAMSHHQLEETSAEELANQTLDQNKSMMKMEKREMPNSVDYEKGFHFYTKPGSYTGITAISLDEFAQKLSVVPAESVMFHFQRKDYQKWIMDVFVDMELAGKIDEINETSVMSDEDLRKKLSETVRNHMAERARRF